MTDLGALVAGAGILGPIGILGYQVYLWLKFAVWLGFPIGILWTMDGAAWPRVEWPGVQIIVDWLLEVLLGLAMLIILVPVGLAMVAAGQSAQASASKARR